MTHTPGPWRTAIRRGYIQVYAGPSESGARLIADCRNDQADMDFMPAAEKIGNCNLIASAPNMHEAIRGTAEVLTEVCDFLKNGTPIVNGSEMHADLLAYRDRLKQLIQL